MRRTRHTSRIYWLRVKIFFIILLILSFLSIVYWFLFLSPYLQIKEITIKGFNQGFSKKIELILKQNNLRFTPFLIYEIFPQYIRNNKSYISFISSDLKNLILKQHPEIEEMDMDLNIKEGILAVNIKQRVIDFLLCDQYETVLLNQDESVLPNEDRDCYYMDKNGVIFEKALETQGSFINQIVFLKTGKRSLGDEVISQDKLEKLDKIFILAKSEESSISIDFLEIKEENFSSLKIIVNEGFYILYNLSDDFSEILKIIAGIKEQKTDDDFSNLEYIDCRYLPKIYLSN
ncbi:MAG TPA: hypothetical protein VMZ91_00920 [Candidatus Paceibacterota bacterium]|nr:hypothetical protein [Candidatus Paceibacterota bacterium]